MSADICTDGTVRVTGASRHVVGTVTAVQGSGIVRFTITNAGITADDFVTMLANAPDDYAHRATLAGQPLASSL